MKKTIWRSAIAGMIIAAASAPLSAQVVVSRPVRFGIAGGATVPVSDMSDISKTGWHAGALVEAGVPLFPWGLRVDAMWNQLGEKDTEFGTVKNRIIDGTINATYSFGGLSTTKFYLIGGLGIYNMKTEVENAPVFTFDAVSAQESQRGAPSVATRLAPPARQFGEFDDSETTQTKFGLNAGAGLRFQLTGFSTFIEARWHTIFTEGSNAQIVPISVGITF
ncbi:MAG TPA: outer membrane beta-barrel protein [Gemmatimonadaceae bacterium]|nr:outer membrane beta-barrel protein [Gemmatimonadaceae bacterium]